MFYKYLGKKYIDTRTGYVLEMFKASGHKNKKMYLVHTKRRRGKKIIKREWVYESTISKLINFLEDIK